MSFIGGEHCYSPLFPVCSPQGAGKACSAINSLFSTRESGDPTVKRVSLARPGAHLLTITDINDINPPEQELLTLTLNCYHTPHTRLRSHPSLITDINLSSHHLRELITDINPHCSPIVGASMRLIPPYFSHMCTRGQHATVRYTHREAYTGVYQRGYLPTQVYNSVYKEV